LALERWHRYTKVTGDTAGNKRKLKSAAAGGDVKSAWVPIVPFLQGGRAPGEAMASMCEQGFGPSTGAVLPPRGRKATSGESAVYSTRLPKISHAEL
jgi:hypothetical protein